MRLTVTFEELAGDWGAQVGWVSVDVRGALPGLRINRIPVFQTAAGAATFGLPLLQGQLPGSRYSGITFNSDEHRRHFFERLAAALRATRPDLFEQEPRP